MRAWIPVAALILLLSSCSLRRKPEAKVAPPPPKPAAAKPVRREPLSVPQTAVTLPPPQPVDPAAVHVPAAPPPTPPAPENDHPTRPARRPQSPAAQPVPATKPETPPPSAIAEERPRLQEIVSPQEQRKIAEAIAARKREIGQVLEQAVSRTLTDHEKNLEERVRSFLQLSDQAAGRGDWRQADALSDRALVLARELRGVR